MEDDFADIRNPGDGGEGRWNPVMAAVSDVVGGRAGAYENALRTARQDALREMAQHAESLGGDAVVGVDLDYEVLGRAGSMLMVTTAGTAVKIG